MSDFMTDGSGLPPTKADTYPSTDPSHEWSATDANSLKTALQSVRGYFLGAAAGKVLTGNGGGSMPTFQAAGGVSYNPLPTPPGTLAARWVLNDPGASSAPVYLNSVSPFAQPLLGNNMPSPPTMGTPYGSAPWFNGGCQIYTANGGLNGRASTCTDFQSSNITISVLAYLDQYNGASSLLWTKMYQSSWSGPYTSIQVEINASGTLLAKMTTDASYAAGAPYYVSFMTSQTMPMNRWFLLTVTYDGTTLNLYLNGALASGGSFSGSGAPYYLSSPIKWNGSSGGPFQLGSSPGGGENLYGKVQLFEINSTALSGAQVAAYYAAIKGAQPLLFLP
jgi:hypothetical protein